jgi:hypothetical protein
MFVRNTAPVRCHSWNMKRFLSRRPGMILFALTVWGLASCSSSPISRIDANRALYESWPFEMQSAVLEGKAVKGMTPEMVRMALGEPTSIMPNAGYEKGEETWTYEKSSGSSAALPNIGLGGSIGGVGVSRGRRGGGGSRSPSGTEEILVIFQKGVVTRVN